MPDLGIVLSHYKADGVTRQNIDSFRDHNRDIPVIPISAEQCFPDSVRVSKKSISGAKYYECVSLGRENAWRNYDLMLFAWHLERNVDCGKWLIVEWDCFCTMPVHDYIRRVSDMNFVAPTTRYPTRDVEWSWFSEINRLGKWMPYAMGIAPVCGTLISDKALTAMAKFQEQEALDCFCELRLGTIGNACGFPAVSNPHASGTIGPAPLGPDDIEIDVKALWHPVKFEV